VFSQEYTTIILKAIPFLVYILFILNTLIIFGKIL
jgi:hypothetical protein